LTDEQWNCIQPLLPVRKPKREDRPGRPPTDARPLCILWVLHTGAQWSELPRKYPPYQTCHRWFQGWVKDGTFRKVLRELARHLKERGDFDLEEGFVDASFSGAKKGGSCVGKTKRGKGTKVVAAIDGAGLPLAVGIASASPHEVRVLAAYRLARGPRGPKRTDAHGHARTDGRPIFRGKTGGPLVPSEGGELPLAGSIPATSTCRSPAISPGCWAFFALISARTRSVPLRRLWACAA
jgi:transposase